MTEYKIGGPLKQFTALEKTGAWTKLAEQSKRELVDPNA